MNAQKVEDMLGRAVASCRLLVLGDGAIEAAAPARGAAARLSSRPCPRPRAGLHVRAPRAPSSAAAAAAAPGLRPTAPCAGPPRAAPAPAPAPAEPGDAGPAALGVAARPGSARRPPMRGARPMRVPGAAGAPRGPRCWLGRPAAEGTKRRNRASGWRQRRPGAPAAWAPLGEDGPASVKFVDWGRVARRPSAPTSFPRLCLQRWVPDLAWAGGTGVYSKYRGLWTLSLDGPCHACSGFFVGILKPLEGTALDPRRVSWAPRKGCSFPQAGHCQARTHVPGALSSAPLQCLHLCLPSWPW